MTTVPAGELASLVREHIAADRYVSDHAIAIEASDRLGMGVTERLVARLRRNLGLGKRAVRERDDQRWNMSYALAEFS